jgi:hypothetical protein
MKTLSLLIALVAVVSLACTNTSDESEQATAPPQDLDCAKVQQEVANYGCLTALIEFEDCTFGTPESTSAEQAEWCACAVSLLLDRIDLLCWD